MKTNFSSLARLIATFGMLVSTLTADPACCASKAEVAPKPATSCCATLETAPYSRDSVYQLEGKFLNDRGEAVSLGSLRGRPVIIAMFFAGCGYACPLLLSDMAQIQAQISQTVRKDVALVLVSFDAKRDTPAALREFRTTRDLSPAWVLLTGQNDSVAELAAVLGVKYTLQADGQYAHSNLLTVLNAEGEITHQRTGLKGGHEQVAAAVMRQARQTK